MADDDQVSKAASKAALMAAKLSRYQQMLNEVDEFERRMLEADRKAELIGLGLVAFRKQVKTEMKVLKKIFSIERSEQSISRSSLTSRTKTEIVWAAAKRYGGLVSVKSQNGGGADLITQQRRLWVLVFPITESRLLLEVAKQGWTAPNSDSEDSDTEKQGTAAAGLVDLPLLRRVRKLTDKTKDRYVDYALPQIHCIMPGLTPGKHPEIDAVISAVQQAGATVEFASEDLVSSPNRLGDVFPRMSAQRSPRMTDTLNLDCTTLFALVSDISHSKSEDLMEKLFGRMGLSKEISGQILTESKKPLLPSTIYPWLANRRLVCTEETAKHFRETVNIMGTGSEQVRTDWMVGHKAHAEIIGHLNTKSKDVVPLSMRYPIEVVSDPVPETFSPLMKAVAAQINGAANRSTLMYGWQSGLTTVTANYRVTKQLESLVLKYRTDGTRGPEILVSRVCRSLLSKEKKNLTNVGGQAVPWDEKDSFDEFFQDEEFAGSEDSS
ncbi:hypothetical protein K402DRAFT_370850 [Aulographum hederae CBS 113979]|uniref:DUF1308 domain-containing protein n=1 Tax=Aulographum hederae CBS 113979 TaxID=1176131 RepID=A0A6G1HAC0_9PEZI|nr:hypothetical protein K402DRAFT_370850 [Aulographum hederae CBS 113979]